MVETSVINCKCCDHIIKQKLYPICDDCECFAADQTEKEIERFKKIIDIIGRGLISANQTVESEGQSNATIDEALLVYRAYTVHILGEKHDKAR